jgi:hypothetical protein
MFYLDLIVGGLLFCLGVYALERLTHRLVNCFLYGDASADA